MTPLSDTVRDLLKPPASTTNGYKKPEPATPPLKAGWSAKRHIEAINPYQERMKRESQQVRAAAARNRHLPPPRVP